MSLQDGFTDKMQAARDHAARARHLGKAGGRPKYAKAAPIEDTTENRLYLENTALSRQVRELENQLESIRLNGGELEPIDDAGAEFDRLFAGAKKVGPGLPAEPRSPQHQPTPARTRGTHTMKSDHTTEKDTAARKAAEKLLSQGLASPAEVARLAGVSRQLVNHWARGIVWRKARDAQLAKAWRSALRA